MPHFLIVGAGVAAAAAALELAPQGHDITVVDKAARPGGRCATRRRRAARDSPWFDHGAQYFTARDPVFRETVEADLAAGRLQRWQPATAQATHGADGWQLQASPDERERLIGPNGLKAWVGEHLAASGAEIHSQTRVRALRPFSSNTGQGWRVELENASALAADRLIVTPPAPQAAVLLGEQADGFASLATAHTALDPCLTAVVEAPARSDAEAVFVKDGRLSWFADNSHKSGATHERRLWTLHAGPDFSREWLEEDPEAAAEVLIDEFAAITGFVRAQLQPIYSHRWRYARPGAGAPSPEQGCELSMDPRLALAGDWLAGGRVEGAWLSGRAAARRLLEDL